MFKLSTIAVIAGIVLISLAYLALFDKAAEIQAMKHNVSKSQ